jgi:GNAT superfamily N-acetyltransferase
MRLRPLAVRDLPAIQALLDADPAYARRVTGADPAPGSATDLLLDRPPDLHSDRKVVLGAIDEHGLAAVVDVLRGWPTPPVAHIGLLQVHPTRQRQGVGRHAHDLLLEWLAARWPEVHTLRAAIVATNADSAGPFWVALGYRPAEAPKPYQVGTTATTVSVWTRPVALQERRAR